MADSVIPYAGEISKSAISDCSRLIDSGLFDQESVKGAHIRRGIALLEAGELDSAISDFGWVIENDPGDPDAYHYRGRTYGLKGEYNRAIFDLNKAIEIGPRATKRPMQRLAQLTKSRNTKDGDAEAESSDLAEPASKSPLFTLHRTRAEIYEASGQFRLAIKDLSDAIALNGTEAEVFRRRGNLYLETGRINQAISDLSQSIELDPDNPLAYQNRGAAYARRRRHHRAFSDFGAAIVLDPTLAQAYRGRGTIYGVHGQHAQALADFSKMVALLPEEAAAHHLRGTAFMAMKRTDEAIAEFNLALDCDPRFAEAHNSLGIAYLEDGKHRKAVEAFSRAIDYDSKLVEAYQRRAEAFRALGKPGEAEEDLRKAELEKAGGTEKSNDDQKAGPDFVAKFTDRGRAAKPAEVIDSAPEDNEFKDLQRAAMERMASKRAAQQKQKEVEQAAQEQTEQVGHERAAQDYAAQQQSTREQAVQERAVREHTSREHAAQERTLRDRMDVAGGLSDRSVVNSSKPADEVDEIDDLTSKSAEAQAEGRYGDAIDLLNRIIAIDPARPDAYHARGNALAAEGWGEEALLDYGKAIELDPKVTAFYIDRATLFEEMARYEDALASLDTAIGFEEDAEARFARGQLYGRIGDHAAAWRDFDSVLARRFDFPGVHVARGIAALKLGDYTKAIDDLTSALTLPVGSKHDRLPAYFHRATAYHALGRYDEAVLNFDNVIALSNDHVDAYMGRSASREAQGDLDRAVDDLSKAISHDPENFEAVYARATAYTQLKQKDRALKDFDRALDLQDQSSEAWQGRAYVHALAQRYEPALHDYTKALELRPDDPDCYFSRGCIYAEIGQQDKALADYARTIELNPGDVGAYFNRAIILETQGKLKEALLDLANVVKVDAQNADAHERAGCILRQLERYNEALTAFDAALSIDPGNVNVEELRRECSDAKDAKTAPSHIAKPIKAFQVAKQKLSEVVSEDRSYLSARMAAAKTLDLQTAPPERAASKAAESRFPAPAPEAPEPVSMQRAVRKIATPKMGVPERAAPKSFADKREEPELTDTETASLERVARKFAARRDIVPGQVAPKPVAAKREVSDRTLPGGQAREFPIVERAATELNGPHRGAAKSSANDVPKALADADAAVKSNPRDARAYAMRGFVHIGLGQWERALSDFRKSFAIDPELDEALKGFERLGVQPWLASPFGR